MFVRFRKIISDGRRPEAVITALACQDRCKKRRDLKCPIKPRCRWRIGSAAPYRLQVSIVENRRIEGRVYQEVIAELGSIDGYLLPEFWQEESLKADNWYQRSVFARIAFWNIAKPRLDHLANRLDPKTMCMAIHARIPWPKQNERDLADARADFACLHATCQTFAAGPIERNEKLIEKLKTENAELRKLGAPYVDEIHRATQRLSRLQ
jgi:hypothetical protein